MENHAENFNEESRVSAIPRRRYTDRFAPEFATTGFRVGRISWGSVFAGVFIALAVQITLVMLPISFGMVFLGPESPGSPGAISWTTAIMHILTMAISLFLGAYIASKLSNVPKRSTGMLHGLTVWSLAVLFNVFLIGQLFSGVTTGVTNAVRGLSGMDVNFSFMDTLPQGLRNELNQLNLDLTDLRTEISQILEQTNNPNLTQEALNQEIEQVRDISNRALQRIILSPGDAGQDFNQMVDQIVTATQDTWGNVRAEDIANVVAARTNLTDDQALVVGQRWKRQIDQAVNNFEQNIRNAREQVVQGADQAMDWLGQLALFSFLALAIGAGIALWGGFTGTPKTVASSESEHHIH